MTDGNEHEMKHDNYSKYTEIVLTKHDNVFYTINYIAPDDERYALYATKEEVLEELSEHMDLMEA